MKLDILVISAHPDDAELCCSGTIAKHIEKGDTVGMIELTKGELGTRGTPELRIAEAEIARKVLKVTVRDNLGFNDGLFTIDVEHKKRIAEKIRMYQPNLVITNAPRDRHPDHGRASKLVSEACFLSGLRKFETFSDGKSQAPHRPSQIFHFIQNDYLEPDFVIDITPYWKTKVDSIKSFKSQFHDPNSNEPESFISSERFLDFIEGRAREMGHKIGVEFGEGFITSKMIEVQDLNAIL